MSLLFNPDFGPTAVSSLTELAALNPPGGIVVVLGSSQTTAANRYYWNKTSTETANGTTVVAANDFTQGRWLLIGTTSDLIALEALGLSASNSASANVTAMQAALANGGSFSLTTPGTYLVNTTYASSAYGIWTLADFTRLYIGPGVIIKNESTTAIPFFVNSNARSNRIGISTITADAAPPYSYYTTVTVTTSAAHGLTSANVGNFIYIQGDTGEWYNGVHRITGITSTTAFTFDLFRNDGSTVPDGAGTMYCYLANAHITIDCLGELDTSYAVGQGGAGTASRICILLNKIGYSDVQARTVRHASRGIQLCNTYHCKVHDITAYSAGACVQVTGPAYELRIDGIRGYHGDALCDILTNDLQGTSFYDADGRVNSGGPILGVTVDNITSESSNRAVQLSSEVGNRLDRVTIGKVSRKGGYGPVVDIVSFNPRAWAATTAYGLGEIRRPTSANSRIYVVTTAGTSGGSEPTWTTTNGATQADGTVVWTCQTEPTNVIGTVTVDGPVNYQPMIGHDVVKINGTNRAMTVQQVSVRALRVADGSGCDGLCDGRIINVAASTAATTITTLTCNDYDVIQDLANATGAFNLFQLNQTGVTVSTLRTSSGRVRNSGTTQGGNLIAIASATRVEINDVDCVLRNGAIVSTGAGADGAIVYASNVKVDGPGGGSNCNGLVDSNVNISIYAMFCQLGTNTATGLFRTSNGTGKTIALTLGGCNVGNILVYLVGTSNTFNIRSMGGNTFTGAQNSWGTTSTFNFIGNCADISVTDLSNIARVDGTIIYNTNAALGTLGAAGLVVGQGTAANSWRLMGDPTKQY